MAASHGLVAAATFPRMTLCVGDARHGCLAWIGRRGDLSQDGFACRELEFAIRWLAASHGFEP
jgi:hypothetical protein